LYNQKSDRFKVWYFVGKVEEVELAEVRKWVENAQYSMDI
jgi:hypothetical protein